MQSLFGWLLLLIIIYGAYLIFSPDPNIPDVEEAVQEGSEIVQRVADLPESVPSPGIQEGAVAYHEETLPEDTTSEEDDYGFFSGTMEYLASALSSYKELLNSESEREGSGRESQDFSSEEDSSEALLIYRDMLDIQSKAGTRP